jgi:hypothetical protein
MKKGPEIFGKMKAPLRFGSMELEPNRRGAFTQSAVPFFHRTGIAVVEGHELRAAEPFAEADAQGAQHLSLRSTDLRPRNRAQLSCIR